LLALIEATAIDGKSLGGKTVAQRAAERWAVQIIIGDARARDSALDRLIGKPVQPIAGVLGLVDIPDIGEPYEIPARDPRPDPRTFGNGDTNGDTSENGNP
jgi:hypothetical protein